MLTPDQVLEVVAHLGRPGVNGRVEALRRGNPGQNGLRAGGLTFAQRDFLTAAAQTPPTPRRTYVHPADTAQGRATADATRRQRTGTEQQPLSAGDVAWLQRIPNDPSTVPFADAERLLTLAGTITNPNDRALVQSIAAPVREYHDHKRAEADLANAQQPLPPAPPEALSALADAIAADQDQLEPDEIVLRASNMLREHGQKRQTEQQRAVFDAQRRIDQLKQAATDRVAVHR